ncbi:hypothetical protein OF377_01180 [Ureaplasma sp. ES3154-GEN]|uniref:hypothetical protein n=1 Tax=Ureaplasma sp. ES3154-GEN TaxID=2984844 RepID=UPI0021E934B3|nr:hypothetical protein [Ureaplasma sp. ES3154-GEN]MCV3743500.1 hypothetical protein [Ureaplasma sp. ES3154-GEN]
MKQRLINYLIVLAGILAVISIAVGFGVFMHAQNTNLQANDNSLDKQEWGQLGSFYVRETLDPNAFKKLTFNQQNIIVNERGDIFNSLLSFNKVNLATQIVPVFTVLLSGLSILLYFYLNKKERAKIKENINPKWVRHSLLTTSIAMGSVLLITIFLSYLLVGLNFVDNNYYNLSTIQEKYDLLVKMLNHKKIGYIVVFILVILFATIVVGFNNFVSFRITYQITAYATKHKYDADRLDPRTEYFDVVESSQDEYMKFVLEQKQTMSTKVFSEITEVENQLLKAANIDFVTGLINKKIELRQQATNDVLMRTQKEQPKYDEFISDSQDSQGSSGNF